MPEYYNDVSHMYQEPAKELKNGKFQCPVCGAEYATRSGVFKHMQKQDCAPASLMFEGTITEDVAHSLFCDTVGHYSKHQRKSLSSFRKSKHYRGVLQATLHCMNNKIDSVLFMEWIRMSKKPRYYNHLMSLAVKDSTLVDFRNHLIKNEELIDSSYFFERNEEQILKSDSFLIRSLQRGDIGLDYCMNHKDIDLMSRIDGMCEANRIHLLSVVKVKEG